MLTRAEKEKLVIKLYNDGKTIRETSKIVHMSFGDIGGIIRKYTGEKKPKRTKIIIENTQALKLFYEGKSPVEAAIRLDMSPMEITDIHDEYLQLTQQYEFIVTYRRIKDDFPSFMKLYYMMDIRGIGEQDVLNLVQLSNDIKSLNDYYDETLNYVNNISIEKQNKIKELNDLNKKIEDAKQTFDSIDLEIKLKKYMSNNKFELKEDDQGESIIEENKLK